MKLITKNITVDKLTTILVTYHNEGKTIIAKVTGIYDQRLTVLCHNIVNFNTLQPVNGKFGV